MTDHRSFCCQRARVAAITAAAAVDDQQVSSRSTVNTMVDFSVHLLSSQTL
jgi:hypothetical protein